ncbi:MAG TPA: 1,2-phenylacetyl-CoA epoxidase subunit PaaD [Rhizomicrobium sp.]|jgi:ring-1,2-phenylacetyl-CoA epoxidase subunit PaaD
MLSLSKHERLGSRFRGNDSKNLEQSVLEILCHVPDPEIPCVSVVDLGIVREVRDGDPPVVTITPTYSGCPATLAIRAAIRTALDDAGLSEMRIETALSPAWTTDWISDQGREKLRAYGIAPPPQGAAQHSLRDHAAACPRCGSPHTEEISRFGSTPCKALHRCLDCGEPFDRFKCH